MLQLFAHVPVAQLAMPFVIGPQATPQPPQFVAVLV